MGIAGQSFTNESFKTCIASAALTKEDRELWFEFIDRAEEGLFGELQLVLLERPDSIQALTEILRAKTGMSLSDGTRSEGLLEDEDDLLRRWDEETS